MLQDRATRCGAAHVADRSASAGGEGLEAGDYVQQLFGDRLLAEEAEVHVHLLEPVLDVAFGGLH